MVFHILKYWASWLVPLFYKRVQVKNLSVLETNEPVIIAMNHPNAFTDPMAFAYCAYPVRLHYLARGDVFRRGLLARILNSIGILPIFRLQDGGKDGLKKNEDSYQRVYTLLRKGAKVIVFAEGLCIQERRLRPLKKGVARMVFGAFEALGRGDLKVVPVGVNYSKPDKFRSNLFYNIGEPIHVKDFLPEYLSHPSRGYNSFLEHLEHKMRELVTHINDPKNDEVVYLVEMLCKRSMLRTGGLDRKNLDHQLQVQKEITRQVNTAAIADPEKLESFRTNARIYFDELKKKRLRDWLIDPANRSRVTTDRLVMRIPGVIAGLPLYVTGYLVHYPALYAADRISKRLSRHREFYSSLAIGAGMFTFLIAYMILFGLFVFTMPHVWWAVAGCVALVLCGIFSVWFHPFLYRTLGMLRILKNPETRAGLEKQREELLALVNIFCSPRTVSPAR
jgi:glycerol-3-phosphate O-acyltransferase / dihydroxyacetone phosphate acyltransferase